MKISKKYNIFIFAVLMAFVMTLMTTLATAVASAGISRELVPIWYSRFAVAFIVGVPTLLLAFPFIRRIADSIAYE